MAQLAELNKTWKPDLYWFDDNDDEESAINKLNSRINACQLAAEFYKKALCMDIVSKWKEVSQNENEFIEIRNISFDE